MGSFVQIGVYLRCLDAFEANKMSEIHDGWCGPHISRFMLARKILRRGYYWLRVKNDCSSMSVNAIYQICVNKINRSPALLHNRTSAWPLLMWTIDAIGMIHPKASNGHPFILVALDYFTKWVGATNLFSLVRNNIICRYGLLQFIITIMPRTSAMI